MRHIRLHRNSTFAGYTGAADSFILRSTSGVDQTEIVCRPCCRQATATRITTIHLNIREGDPYGKHT